REDGRAALRNSRRSRSYRRPLSWPFPQDALFAARRARNAVHVKNLHGETANPLADFLEECRPVARFEDLAVGQHVDLQTPVDHFHLQAGNGGDVLEAIDDLGAEEPPAPGALDELR